GDDAIAGAHRKEHLRRGRDDRNDAPRLRAERRCEKQQSNQYVVADFSRPVRLKADTTYEVYHRPRNSSHRKNGPPIIAVMMPTGISTGATMVRAIRSQTIRNDAPKSADAGSTIR